MEFKQIIKKTVTGENALNNLRKEAEKNKMSFEIVSQKMNGENIAYYVKLEGYPKIKYEDLVVYLIRKKYNENQEFAIIRQRDVKQEEFNEYFAFTESCKEQAKQMIAERDLFIQTLEANK